MLDGKAATEATETSGVVTVTITQPIVLKRRGAEIRIVVEDGTTTKKAVDQTLVDTIAKAHLGIQCLTDGSEASIADVAGDLKMDASDLSRILPLAFMSQKLTEAILTGRQPADLTLRRLTRGGELPIEWAKQDELLAG